MKRDANDVARECGPGGLRSELEQMEHEAPELALADVGPDLDTPHNAAPRERCAPFVIQSARELLRNHPHLREPVVHGLLRCGETMNVIAPPKTGKSWLTLGLALSVAAGRDWLGFRVEPGRVLILDNELHRETLASRLPRVAETLCIPLDSEAIAGVDVVSLRGALRDLFGLADDLRAIESGTYRIVILDAFYRFLPKGTDENDNGTMANLYNTLDALAARLGCAFVCIHHTSKGVQTGRAVTDVGAGAGAQSRATDCHLVLRPHEEPGAVVLEAAIRSWAPIEPLCLRWRFPTWELAADLNPADLAHTKPRKKSKPAESDAENSTEPGWSGERFAAAFLAAEPRSRSTILLAAEEADLSNNRARRYLQNAVDTGRAHEWHGVGGNNRERRFATVPQPKLDLQPPQKRGVGRPRRK
ncbi:MAG: hypothetical protein AMXMBFR7_09600 [Planctomycetota bacterium]